VIDFVVEIDVCHRGDVEVEAAFGELSHLSL